MTSLRDRGLAKLNLTLEVLGRRADDFHEIRSLVAFARFGDELTLEPGEGLDLTVDGPFADALEGGNLILRAAETVKRELPALRLGRFRLTKNLPVAAGLGGGSADAAAALRLIARANQGVSSEAALAELAPTLGSDVSVCLASRPAFVTGRGARVEPVRGFPACGVLLANPRLPLATESAYAALKAPPLATQVPPQANKLDFEGDFARLLDYALPRGNGLEAPATRLVPQINEVLAALAALDGVKLARMSGSGPTCFGLFASQGEAARAAATLAASHPHWWIVASALGD
jgi:4-diphosphocytidyl-2-C-methyl-D-erythritol kinase